MDAPRLLRRALPIVLLAAAAFLLRRRRRRLALPRGPLPAPALTEDTQTAPSAPASEEDARTEAVEAAPGSAPDEVEEAGASHGWPEDEAGAPPARFERRPIDIVTVVDDLLDGGR